VRTFLDAVLKFVLYYSGANTLYMAFRKPHVAILGYHSISHTSNSAQFHGEVYEHLSVPAHVFERQMSYLKKHGYVFLRFSDLRDIRERKRLLPKRAALIYFDDGYKDNFVNAYPILKRMDIPATIFVVTDCLDKKKILWETALHSEDVNIFLSWDELRSMRDVFDIGTHTVTHRKLTGLALEEVREEFEKSRAYIEEKTGAEVIALSYPKSRFTPQIRAVAAECGFDFMLAHGRGFSHSADFQFLEKIPIGSEDTLRTFKLKLGIYYPLLSLIRWSSRL